MSDIKQVDDHLPGSIYEKWRCKVFVINDSGKHIVAAKKITDAYQIVAEFAGYETAAKYVAAESPTIHEMSPYEEVRVNMTDNVEIPSLKAKDLPDADDWPENVRVETTVVVRGFAQDWMSRDWTGLIGTTEV